MIHQAQVHIHSIWQLKHELFVSNWLNTHGTALDSMLITRSYESNIRFIDRVKDKFSFVPESYTTFFAVGSDYVIMAHVSEDETGPRNHINFTITAEPTRLKELHQYFVTNFEPQQNNFVTWQCSPENSISVRIDPKPYWDEAYPFIEGGIAQYIEDYLASPASILVLQGPPGTGKTSFIRELLIRSARQSMITFDSQVMQGDSFFASFIDRTNMGTLVMEDADAFMQARSSSNHLMHRFLNVGDGLVSMSNKKLVFSTNLPSIKDIDSALIRPGRCFDVIQFRELTRAEAEKVAERLGNRLVPKADGQTYSLAEIYNARDQGDVMRSQRRVGFI